MAKDILILGESGSGKSTSFRKLPPKETFIFNVSQKPLPFKGSFKSYTEFDPASKTGNMLSTDNSSVISKVMAWIKTQDHIKYVILDDLNYTMQKEYLRRASETGFNKFVEIGQHFNDLIEQGKKLPNDKYFIVTMHPETEMDSEGVVKIKPKTVGKLIDKYLVIEGVFTVVLLAQVKEVEEEELEYYFETQSRRGSVSKSPMGMLDFKEPNDIVEIIKKIENYYN